jgi:hypothetical protein
MVTSDETIRQMNALVEGSMAEVGGTVEQALGQQIAEEEAAVDPKEPSEEQSEDPVSEAPRQDPSEDPVREEPGEDPMSEPENQDDVPELTPAEDDESEDEAEDDEESDNEEEESEPEGVLRRSERIKKGVRKPTRYAGHTKEIELVFKDLKAVQVVKREDIPKGIPAFGTHLFTVEKFKADGSTDKFKSRLVAHGNEQDASLYPDRSSPTAQMHAIMTCLTVAACNPQYKVAKLDVKGAFMQTEMSGTPVYVKCMGRLRDKILKIFPSMKQFVGNERVLYGVLRKALYGCV